MRISSPSRTVTFFSVLFFAILVMASAEWRFIFQSQSTKGIVTMVGRNGNYRIQFISNHKEFNSVVRSPGGIPEFEKDEMVNIRFTLNSDGTLNRCYVSWFWSIFHNKILILIVLCLPWFAFVWSMPAKWTMVLGGKKKPKENVLPIDPEKWIKGNDQP